MAILGNYQIRPDSYRERGYSGYVELAWSRHLAFGASSLFTRAQRDIFYRVTDYRQAHGLFVRYSPVQPLVVMAEADWRYQSLTYNGHRAGYSALVQADWEMKQGIHFMLTGEGNQEGNAGELASYGLGGSFISFFAPHANLRLDDTYRRLGQVGAAVDAFSWMMALHVYL